MDRRHFLFVYVLCICLCLSQVSTGDQNALCSLQTCSAIAERLQSQEVRIQKLEEAFRRTVSALTTASKVLEGDTAVRNVVDTPTNNQSTDLSQLIALSSGIQVEEAAELPSNGRHQEPSIKTQQQKNGNGATNASTVTPEALKADLDKVSRQMSGIYDVIGQWEKGIKEQNRTIMKLDQRLQEALVGPSVNSIERPTFEESTVDKSFISESINHLKGGVQCSLAHLVDFDYPDYFSPSRYLSGESPVYGTSSIEVILNQEGSLAIQWQLPSNKCDQYLTGAWVRVFEPNPQSNKSNAPFFKVPKDCLKRSTGVFSLELPSTSKSYDMCHFHLDLTECREHTVEVVPSYNGLRGKVLVTRFKSPPKMTSSSTALRAVSFSAAASAFNLNWTVNSNDCDRQLDSLSLKIHDEKTGNTPVSFTITNQCFSKTSTNPGTRNYANPFTTSLAPNHRFDDCRYQWTRLDQCQKYRLELEPTYWSGSWNERTLHKFPPVSMTVFTSESSPECCNRLTAPSGALSSPAIRDRLNGPRECFWWITVQQNYTIWLTITQLKLKSGDYIKIFDGPDVDSPVLLALSEDAKPLSVRSASNHLFVKTSCCGSHRDFKAVYTSVEDDGTSFVPGCGGYIRGSGTISSPHYPSGNYSQLECVWYVESESQQHTILLDNLHSKTAVQTSNPSYTMAVYEGWLVTGETAFDTSHENGSEEKTEHLAKQPNVYSLRSRARIHFKSNAMETSTYSWRVSSVSTPL